MDYEEYILHIQEGVRIRTMLLIFDVNNSPLRFTNFES